MKFLNLNILVTNLSINGNSTIGEIFVDDICIMTDASKYSQNIINIALKKIWLWSNKWCLDFNPKKCVTMEFGII